MDYVWTFAGGVVSGGVVVWLFARPALRKAEALLAKVGDLLPPRG